MKVSIITAALNNAGTIEDAITSILGQKHNNMEHIVVDGGSKDGTLEIIKKYEEQISKVISEQDNGVYEAMNKGLKVATGDIVAFLNADDFYANEEVVAKIVETMLANNVDCCYGDLEYVARDNPEKTIRRWKSHSYRDDLFEKGWHPPHPTFVVKRQIYEEYGYFNLKFKIAADYELMLRFMKKHDIKSCYIPSVLVKMRAGGKSNKNLSQIIKANIECYQAWRENGLKISPFIMLRKPASKLVQCVRRN